MKKLVVGLLGLVVGVTSAYGTTFTLKSSVSGVDFDWSLGSNYVGDPAQGPAADDTIVIPEGVTAIANAAAAAQKGTCGICNIQIDAGGTFQVYTPSTARTKTYVQTITGSGTVLQPDVQKNEKGAVQAYDLEIQKSCVFDGKIVGTLNYRIYKTFTLTDVNQSGLKGSPLLNANARFRLTRLGTSGSILGTGSFNMNPGSVVEYIGGPDITGESYAPAVWSGNNYIFDAGAYGGFTYSGKSGTSTIQWNLTLTGSNATTAVFSGYKDSNAGNPGPLAIAKEGTGTWLMKKNGSNKYGSVVEVREGTLAFDDALAPMGVNCSLGMANSLYKFGETAMTDANKVDYSVLLGGDGTEGFLQNAYVGGNIVSNYDRQVVVATKGGLKSGSGRMYFTGITAASAGEKTLILDGEQTVGDTVAAVTNGPGVVSVEKRGSGTWELRPPFGFSGKLTVKGGQLNINNGRGDRYTWYRLRLKMNAYQDPLFSESAIASYRKTPGRGTTDPGTNEKRNITITEFMFFDADGNRQCIYPLEHKDSSLAGNSYTVLNQAANEYAVLCQPGEFAMGNSARNGWIYGVTRPVGGLFEGAAGTTGGWTHYNEWLSQNSPADYDLGDESKWIDIVFRPTNNTPTLVAFDYLNSYAIGSGYEGRDVTAFEVDGSTDGLVWDTLKEVRLTALVGSSTASGALASSRHLDADKLAKCYQLDRTTPAPVAGEVAAPALNLAATVSVAPGATLACFGTVSLSSVALSDAGMGTIEGSGVTLAEEGSFEVEKLTVPTKTFHTSLKGLSGAANLARWTATVNGVEQNYDVAYDAATGDVTVSKRGLMLLVR